MKESSGKPRAVVLVSGGMDSATTLALAVSSGFECYALTVNYGQRHIVELRAAQAVAEALGAVEHKIVVLDLRWVGGSALTAEMPVPKGGTGAGIPVTYVPARNTVLLSLALAWAEVLEARDIFIGANAVDFSGYPDCRPEFIQAFEALANVATRMGVEGKRISVHAPLLHMSKADIVRTGLALGVDFGMTLSCYDPTEDGAACGACDACRWRRKGFAEAGVADPTRYAHL